MKNIFVTSDKTYCIQYNDFKQLNFQKFQNIISNKTNIPIDSLIIKYNGHILYNTVPNFNNNDILTVTHRIRGGKQKNKKDKHKDKRKERKNKDKSNNKIKENFGDGITDIFEPVVDFFEFIWKMIEWSFLVFIWLFTDILNPMVWINDAVEGAFVGLKLIANIMLDAFVAFVSKIFNVIFNPFMKGIFGDDWESKNDSKCYAVSDCSVPYPILFATIILPPLGVFMELGLKGWLNILICALLTLLYYVPGLIYALILLYC